MLHVCDFDTRRGSPELQQVRLLVRFSLRRLRFSLRTHTSVLLYSDTVRCPGDTCNSFRLGRTDASRQNSTTTNARSTSYRYTGSCRTKRFAEFNGKCESCCSLEQLVASLSAADERKSAAGTYHPKTEGYIRRHLYKPPGLLYCGGCTWTRISRQPIIAVTWHFSQQTLLEPLTVTGARVSCSGERYRDVLSRNLDENNTQTSTDCCTVVLRM